MKKWVFRGLIVVVALAAIAISGAVVFTYVLISAMPH